MGIELEGDEVRPTLQLSPEEVRALEEERSALRGSALAVRRSDRGRIRGEGTSLDPEPAPVIPIRARLEAARAAAGEPAELSDTPYVEPLGVESIGRMNMFENPKAFTEREQRRKLNVDPARLAELVSAAQQTADESELADQIAESAGNAARSAREALDAYLEESGLAG